MSMNFSFIKSDLSTCEKVNREIVKLIMMMFMIIVIFIA